MRRFLSRFLRRQEGIAMPVVIGTLTITTGLAAGTFATVMEGNQSSAHDRDSKAALGAAEAGLQMAVLRTTQLKPGAEQCVTNSLVAPGTPAWDGSPTPAGECPKWRESLGNGASYTYVVATTSSGACATLGPPPTGAGLSRCITSTGEVNGVRRRLQLRFYFQPPFVPWGQAGLIAKHTVEIDNNAEINSPVGSNGDVYLGVNSIITNQVLIPEDGTFTPHPHSDGATGGVHTVDPWQFPEMDWATPRDENQNDPWITQIPGYNPTTRILTLSQQQEISLPGGTYHLCGLQATNNNWLKVTNGQIVRLYIDSPRGNPNCPNVEGAGRFVVSNKGMFNATDDKNPAELEVYVYGTTEDADDEAKPDVDINNGVHFYGTIWAPDSTISLWNNGESAGGFTGGNISLKNNEDFSYDPRVNDKELPGTATAKNQSWFECRRDPTTPTDPESGCQ